MWKYIVTWCLVYFSWTTVDNYDEFGGYIDSYDISYLKYDCDHEKYFYDRDSAFAFYNRAMKESGGFFSAPLDSVVIDSVFIENIK